MFEYRPGRPEEREACIDLANYAFGTDFETLIPKVYGKGVDFSACHRVAVDERGRVRALVAVLPQTLQVGASSLRAGFLGTVSVHPRARGEGHMNALMKLWSDEMPALHDIVVLNGQRQRYEYFGFTRGGVRWKYHVCRPNLRHALKNVRAEELSFRPLFEIEGAETFVQAINTGRSAFVSREGNLSAIFATLNEQAFGILQGEKLVGYLVVNPNGSAVSELALACPDHIPHAVGAWMTYRNADGIGICAPDYDIPLNGALGRFAETCSMEASAMYNILDFTKVLQAYLTLKHATSRLIPGEFSAVLDGQPVTARVDRNGVTVERSACSGALRLSKLDAQTLLLTPHGRLMGVSVPEGWFPLPIFWYKVDCF